MLDQDENGRFVAVTQELWELARTIRETFIDVRRGFVANASGCSKDQDKHFLWAAMLFQELGEDPVTLVQDIVAHQFTRGKNNVYPLVLHNRELVDEVRRWRTRERLEAMAGYRAQFNLVQARSSQLPLRAVLTDPQLDLSPLLVWVLARSAGYSDLCRSVAPAARKELHRSRVAQELFRDEAVGL